MTMPYRIKVKYFIKEPLPTDWEMMIPVFHRWIQEQRTDGLLIDIADYRHVPDGPGIVLVGHEADYALDLSNGRPGLLYVHKRQGQEVENKKQGNTDENEEALQLRLQKAIRNLQESCTVLENEASVQGSIHIDRSEVEVTFSDRLRTPNQPEVYASAAQAVRTALQAVNQGSTVSVSQVYSDPRYPLTMKAQIAG